MDGAYLVGKVVEVNYLSSRVLLLSDLNSKIPVIVEPNEYSLYFQAQVKIMGLFNIVKNMKILKMSLLFILQEQAVYLRLEYP